MTPKEINEQVARKLGWRYIETFIGSPRWSNPKAHPLQNMPTKVPDYCNSIEAAWEIVEKNDFSLVFDKSKNRWSCRIGEYDMKPSYLSDTAPMAICKAFLKLEDSK